MAAAFLALVCGCANGRGGKTVKDEAETEKKDSVVSVWDTLPNEPVFDIVTTMGTITVKLYSKTPGHRANFIRLVRAGYFDGVLFHRVINHFMIQAGDPLTRDPSRKDDWGTGGPNYTVPAEFVPEYYHKKGALAAARRGDAANPKKASHGSQFYLVQDEFNCLQLDGEYTVFGETVRGFDVIDRIAAVPTDRQDRPLKNVKILKIALSADQNPEPESPDSSYSAFTPDDQEESAEEQSPAVNEAVEEVVKESPDKEGTEVQEETVVQAADSSAAPFIGGPESER